MLNVQKNIWEETDMFELFDLDWNLCHLSRLKFERDLVVNLKHEEEKLTTVLEREEKDIKRLMEVINMIDR